MNLVHVPVLPREVIEYLMPLRRDALVVDATLGEGGHASLFLESLPECRLIGIDADEVMAQRAFERLARWKDRIEIRVGWADEIFNDWPFDSPDVVLMDLGISSFHIEKSGRGFSFRMSEDLDMRLGLNDKTDAGTLVNRLPEKELADLIFHFGEERYSRRIARAIVLERKKSIIKKADRLASVICNAIPGKARNFKLNPAARTFQALRIAVNRELERLERILEIVPQRLSPAGKLGIISFHSLEDRMVKRTFRTLGDDGSFRILTRKPLMPNDKEIKQNSSSRSARFRVVQRDSVT